MLENCLKDSKANLLRPNFLENFPHVPKNSNWAPSKKFLEKLKTPYTVKKVTDFTVLSRDVTNQTLLGGELS